MPPTRCFTMNCFFAAGCLPIPRVVAASVFAGLMAPAVVAQAPGASGATTQKLEAMVVTGSYLPDAAEVKANPLTTIDRAAIEQSGATDALRLLKQLTPLFNGSANAGSEVNLQGMGESY